ncbi:MAG TPA: acetyl-coenzyme A synthetase N-terminal domain-containing protein, partial [Syntrophales bacterium]|nr:acetyl-coenzyme A synthetase N-terminal domain-containing protein [Syntrophales bacterium]
MEDKILWKPKKSVAEKSQMFAFMQRINEKFGCNCREYYDLHAWTLSHVSEFWGEFWEYANIIHSEKHTRVVDDPHRMPGAKWFEGAR